MLGNFIFHRPNEADSILGVQVLGDQAADKLPPAPMVLPWSEAFGVEFSRRREGPESYRGSLFFTGMVHVKNVRIG